MKKTRKVEQTYTVDDLTGQESGKLAAVDVMVGDETGKL